MPSSQTRNYGHELNCVHELYQHLGFRLRYSNHYFTSFLQKSSITDVNTAINRPLLYDLTVTIHPCQLTLMIQLSLQGLPDSNLSENNTFLHEGRKFFKVPCSCIGPINSVSERTTYYPNLVNGHIFRQCHNVSLKSLDFISVISSLPVQII